MMHFDFETQYTLKIPKPQDLVKFNKLDVHQQTLYTYTNNDLLTASSAGCVYE